MSDVVRRRGERIVTTEVPVHLRWIEGEPPSLDTGAVSKSMQHYLIADALRERPGVWAMLPDLSVTHASDIARGSLAAYRPGGSFEAVSRDGMVYARYVG